MGTPIGQDVLTVSEGELDGSFRSCGLLNVDTKEGSPPAVQLFLGG